MARPFDTFDIFSAPVSGDYGDRRESRLQTICYRLCYLLFLGSVQITALSIDLVRSRTSGASLAPSGHPFGILGNFFMFLAMNFALIYWIIGAKENFSVELSKVDALYFALGTLTTAGTGNIYPTNPLAKGLVGGQMLLDFVFVAVALTIAIARWGEGTASPPVASP